MVSFIVQINIKERRRDDYHSEPNHIHNKREEFFLQTELIAIFIELYKHFARSVEVSEGHAY